MDKKTTIFIEIRKSKLPNIQFVLKGLGEYTGSYPTPKAEDPEVVVFIVTYNDHFGYWDKRRLKKSIKLLDGKVTNVLHLGKKPMMSSQTKKRLIINLIISAIIFISTLGATNYVNSPTSLIKGIGISAVPTIGSFLGGLLNDRINS